jgi:hypothetical protein
LRHITVWRGVWRDGTNLSDTGVSGGPRMDPLPVYTAAKGASWAGPPGVPEVACPSGQHAQTDDVLLERRLQLCDRACARAGWEGRALVCTLIFQHREIEQWQASPDISVQAAAEHALALQAARAGAAFTQHMPEEHSHCRV